MKEEDHWKAYQEYRDNIFSWALEIRGLEKSQRTVGLNASRAIVELLSVYLHRNNLVDEGFQLNHRWFKSGKISDKLPDFKNKGKILQKMNYLESSSENLAYGSPKPSEQIKEIIELFNEVEKLILVMLNE
ncbi:MAG: hypothetical protein Q8O41_02495 [Candidatus Methanoperedens sp.]|nr:hypothetical protein [Candidatus Methanoperedens sp.]